MLVCFLHDESIFRFWFICFGRNDCLSKVWQCSQQFRVRCLHSLYTNSHHLLFGFYWEKKSICNWSRRIRFSTFSSFFFPLLLLKHFIIQQKVCGIVTLNSQEYIPQLHLLRKQGKYVLVLNHCSRLQVAQKVFYVIF